MLNDQDAFPDNINEWSDLDGDGIGDNSDPDRDGDGVANELDLFPDDPSESADLDGDGIGDNGDTDLDGDGIPNNQDTFPYDPAPSTSAAERITYYHSDALGSPVAATDESGQVIWQESYQPYGERVKKEASDNRQWFTGKSHNERLGLSYFGARWYDPSAGRFISPDPVDRIDRYTEHAFNRYAYANNNPYKYVDPDGRETIIGSVKIPGWLARLVKPDYLTEGASFGFAVSYPLGDDGAEFDVGFYAGADFINPEVDVPLSRSYGGKATVDVGQSAGSVKDLAGIGFDLSIQASGIGGTRNFTEDGIPSGWEVNVGPGLNIGGNATLTGVLSLRHGLISYKDKKESKQ